MVPQNGPDETAAQVIARLDLAPHPEGGHFRQVWAAPGGTRPGATSILFLLAAGERSHWHRVDADEMWLFQAGAPLALRIGTADASGASVHRLGAGPDAEPQILVPAHRWQSAKSTGAWTLAGCVVSPGFTFDGFDLAPPAFDLPLRD